MAEIPIEKKSGGIPWWVWLILVAAIVAILIWMFAGNDRDDRKVEQSTAVTAPIGAEDPTKTNQMDASANGGPITDLNMLLTSDANTVIGREVRLSGVPAGSVPADAGFWITGDNGQREYVILHEVRTPNTPIEGKINVDQGDRLDIVGTVRSADKGVPKGAAIPGPTDPLPDGVTHYIDALSVTKSK
ncbi:hypothetical protein [Sphingomonas xinjiangensis]|uniref:Uncharacterized protein n=1 Tax=Sphingomonas xinjiangensis TaxID=643568 RepID=A0A840YNY1_9SPHN|nr:hypothetical protein [Sphingomonas xinjiangensis]MBB5711800.1 hypothetical protein [Sphingomonas xinjiangensis]